MKLRTTFVYLLMNSKSEVHRLNLYYNLNHNIYTTAGSSNTSDEKGCTPVTTTVYVTSSVYRRSECKPIILASDSKVVARLLSTQTMSQTVASVSMGPCSKTASVDDKQQQCANTTNPHSSLLALGALLGLLMLTLIIVIAGWAWTCWMLKKRGGTKITSGIRDGYV